MINLDGFLLDPDWSQLLARQVFQVTVLILVVGVIARYCCNHHPHIAHALWTIVLFKCLVPPVISSPASPFVWIDEFSVANVVHEESNTSPAAADQHMPNTPFGHETKVASAQRFEPDRSMVTTSSQVVVRQVDDELRDSPNGHYIGNILLWLWLLGSIVTFAWMACRVIYFLARIRLHQRTPEKHTMELLSKTISEMELSNCRTRNTQVRIVDCLIGPAVVGFIRPRILLPRVLERECSDDDLRMLLAHELTHIHRGDLLWAVVRILASCCMWFHPLVHWATRQFDRITELSCDAEVVTRLRCAPADYARSLLFVLERKHQLRVAPTLPGVRPVQITSERIGQIMRMDSSKSVLRHRSIVLVWLVSIVVVFPGAQRLSGQVAPASETQPASSPLGAAKPWKPATPQSEPGSRSVAIPDNEHLVRRFDGSAALAKIISEDQFDLKQAVTMLNVTLDTVAGAGTQVIVDGKRVVARGSEKQLLAIETELQRIAEHGFQTQIALTSEIRTIPKSVFDRLPMQWKLLQHEKCGQPVLATLLDESERTSAAKLIQQSPLATIHSRPQVATFNGREATIEVGTELPFVVGFDEKVEPEVQVEEERFQLSIRPLFKENDFHMETRLALSRIADFDTFTFAAGGGDVKTVQIPCVIEQSAYVAMTVPSQQTLAVAMPRKDESDRILIAFVTPKLVALDGVAVTQAETLSPPSRLSAK